MKFHTWTDEDDKKLIQAIEDCQPIFDHYKQQGKSYSEANSWDAVAGRLLPDICVTGAACRRRMEIIRQNQEQNDAWKSTIEKVEAYERDLQETTFDGVSELLGQMDFVVECLTRIRVDMDTLKKVWE